MTEKEAWLEIMEKCDRDDSVVFLCHETSRYDGTRPWWRLYASMRRRLLFFVPKRLQAGPGCPCLRGAWWDRDNEVRATACGFLAAMCDDVAE